MDGFVVKRITYAFFRYLCESGLLAIQNGANRMCYLTEKEGQTYGVQDANENKNKEH